MPTEPRQCPLQISVAHPAGARSSRTVRSAGCAVHTRSTLPSVRPGALHSLSGGSAPHTHVLRPVCHGGRRLPTYPLVVHIPHPTVCTVLHSVLSRVCGLYSPHSNTLCLAFCLTCCWEMLVSAGSSWGPFPPHLCR